MLFVKWVMRLNQWLELDFEIQTTFARQRLRFVFTWHFEVIVCAGGNTLKTITIQEKIDKNRQTTKT